MMNAFEEKKKNNHLLWKNTFPIPLVVLKKLLRKNSYCEKHFSDLIHSLKIFFFCENAKYFWGKEKNVHIVKKHLSDSWFVS